MGQKCWIPSCGADAVPNHYGCSSHKEPESTEIRALKLLPAPDLDAPPASDDFDEELKALSAVLHALVPLGEPARERVLSYAARRLGVRVG